MPTKVLDYPIGTFVQMNTKEGDLCFVVEEVDMDLRDVCYECVFYDLECAGVPCTRSSRQDKKDVYFKSTEKVVLKDGEDGVGRANEEECPPQE